METIRRLENIAKRISSIFKGRPKKESKKIIDEMEKQMEEDKNG